MSIQLNTKVYLIGPFTSSSGHHINKSTSLGSFISDCSDIKLSARNIELFYIIICRTYNKAFIIMKMRNVEQFLLKGLMLIFAMFLGSYEKHFILGFNTVGYNTWVWRESLGSLWDS